MNKYLFTNLEGIEATLMVQFLDLQVVQCFNYTC